MATDPQSIPYTPAQPPAPPPFQPGAYAGIAQTQIAKQPTNLDWARQFSDSTNQALQSYLEQQRINQQGPLIQAQTQDVQSQAAARQADTAYQYGSQKPGPLDLYGGGPSLGGVSSSAPQPADGGTSPGYGGAPAPTMGGRGPLSVQYPQYASGGVPDTGLTMDHYNAGVPGATHLGWEQFKQGQQPQAPQTPSYNPNDPYGLGIDMSQIGAKRYGGYQQANASRLLGDAPAAQSIFGPNAGKVGLTAKDVSEAANAQALSGLKRDEFTFNQNKFNTDKQVAAKNDAQKLFNDYVTTDSATTAAKTALSRVRTNPATFNTALFEVGKALGVTSRNPQLVIQAISAGNPSLAGEVTEYLSKKGSGQLTPELIKGLGTMVDDVANSNRSGFESKAVSHAQQNAGFFGGNVDSAKSQLFPSYQWGGGQGVMRATNKTTGQKIQSTDGGKTWTPA